MVVSTAPSWGVSIDLQLLDVAARQHRLLTRSDIRRIGISSKQFCRRVDRGELVEIAPGIWTHAAVDVTWELRVRAGLLWLGNDAAISGEAAARWWELDGFTSDVVEFVTPRRRRSMSPRFELHTTTIWTSIDLLNHRGIRCTSATRTILDLAGRDIPARRLGSAIDSAVRGRLTSIPTLTARMADASFERRHGIGRLREVMLDSGGESALERRFLKLARSEGLPRPVCQVAHRPRSGRAMRVDFQFPGTNVIVEVSGRLGHTSDADRARDARRRNELQLAGYHVLEFTTTDLLDAPNYVVSTIRTALSHAPTASSAVAM